MINRVEKLMNDADRPDIAKVTRKAMTDLLNDLGRAAGRLSGSYSGLEACLKREKALPQEVVGHVLLDLLHGQMAILTAVTGLLQQQVNMKDVFQEN